MTYDDELTEPLDRADWEQREVYAKFGVAIYFCQVLETALVTYIAMLTRVHSGRAMSTDEVDELYAQLFGNTLGRNINSVRRLLDPEGTWVLDGEMRRILELRNRLVHHWMRERVLRQDTSDNRRAMIAELEAAIATLQEADRLLTDRTLEMMETGGVSRDAIQREYERITTLAERGEDDPDAPPYFSPSSE